MRLGVIGELVGAAAVVFRIIRVKKFMNVTGSVTILRKRRNQNRKAVRSEDHSEYPRAINVALRNIESGARALY